MSAQKPKGGRGGGYKVCSSALAELRRARQMSQAELAQVLGIRQPSIADMEKRTGMYISTLRGLIEGMGGELDIIARFPGQQEVRIKNFGFLAVSSG